MICAKRSNMRFIGGKTLLLPNILELIKNQAPMVNTVSDLFSGSGAVSRYLAENGYATYSNDLMYFSYVLLRGSICITTPITFRGLDKLGIGDPIFWFNRISYDWLKNNVSDNYFIYCNYSPYGDRRYFTEENALRIDYIRLTIEEWKEKELISDDEYFYLLCALIEAVPFVSNTTGVYGAYLKHWDRRALKPLNLLHHKIVNPRTTHIAYNTDTLRLVSDIKVDLAYYDPPYNQRQYLPNYHVLETLAKYDHPTISGKTGLRNYDDQKSKFCSKNTVFEEAKRLVDNTKAEYIVFSYNSEGILSEEEIKEILFSFGKEQSFQQIRLEYNRYKNASTKRNNNLAENLYFIRRK